MKVLAIVPSAFCFGLQNMELALFAHLRHRMQCHFLLTRWTDGEFGRRLDALGIAHSSAWLGMFSRRLDWHNLKMTLECLLRLPGAWRDFIVLYRRLRPDVVYLASHHEVILLLPLLVFIRRRVVCHMHDPPPAIAFQKLSAWFWRRGVGRFLFISNDARQRMAALISLGPSDDVIHNGVAIAPLALPRHRDDTLAWRSGWPPRTIIIGISGQIAAHKGHDDLIEAFRLVRQANADIRLLIGGRGEEAYVTLLKQRIAALHLDDAVAFCGWLPEAGAFYAGIDVLVLASRHEEGFGLVVAEAGERALPSIVTRSGGVVEVVEEGATALAVPKNTPQALAAAILLLAANPDLRAAIGARARARIAAAFDLTRQAARFGDALQAMAAAP